VGLIASAFATRAAPEVRPTDPDRRRHGDLLQGPPAARVYVDEHVAMTHSAVFVAVTLLANYGAVVSFRIFRRLRPRGREEAHHYLDRLLQVQANPEMSAFQARRAMGVHLATWGNAYAEIVRTLRGRVAAWWPIEPWRVHPFRDDVDGRLKYEVAGPEGGPETVLEAESVLHVRGLSYDGIVGLSPITLARETVSAGLAQDRYSSSFWGNDARPAYSITHPGELGDVAQDRLIASIRRRYGSDSNRWLPLILEEGMTTAPIALPAKDAQFLESKQWTVQEIARWFNLPPHKLKDLARATWGNIDVQEQEMVKDAILPSAKAWEGEVDAKLLTPAEVDEGLYSRENLNSLVRGDIATRGRFYDVMTRIGAYSINDVLELEDRNPVHNGDTHFVPLNMVPLDQAVEGGAAERAGARRGGSSAEAAERALYPVFEQALARVLRREAQAASGAWTKRRAAPQAWAAWLADFYAGHAEVVHEALGPTAEAVAELVGAGPGVEATVRRVLEDYSLEHVATSIAELQRGPEGVAEAWPDRASTAALAVLETLVREMISS